MNKLYAFLFAIIFLATAVSAYPYQLNLTDGNLIDLNASNNMTNNITIYIIHENATIFNNTINTTINITNNPITEIYNSTYINYIWNGTTNSTFDERFVLFDTRYVEESEFNSYKNNLLIPTKTEFDNLVTKVNNINMTGVENPISHGGLWSMSIVAFILALVAFVFIIIIKRSMENEQY